jgi:DNA-binding transcriptional LysR family regulator
VVRKIDWDAQIGRRLKMRDLHVFLTVVECGSMAKAAAQLGVSQPAVSEIVTGLEHAVGVRLLDRSQRGVESTIYGHALLERIRAAFYELKEGIRTIEHLADPTVGELRIGCPQSLASSILPPIIERFSTQYPGVVLSVKDVVSPALELPELRAGGLDIVFDRPLAHEDDDLNVEILFDDEMVVAAGMQTSWARRNKVDLAELVEEPWILTPPGSWIHTSVGEAFGARGLALPKAFLMTFCIHLRAKLLATRPFVSAFPSSFLRLNATQLSLQVLPIDLAVRPWSVVIVTRKNRTLSPHVQRFINHARAFTGSMDVRPKPEKKSA